MISGFKGEQKKIPFLRLPLVRAAARWASNRSSNPFTQKFGQAANSNQSGITYVNPEFDGMDQAVSETGFDLESGSYHDEMIGRSSSTTERHQASETEMSPTPEEVESVFLSLIQQGFLRGFVLHTSGNPRFAIPGSQAGGGPVMRGFPNVWETVMSKVGESGNEPVPGWIKQEMLGGMGGSLRAGGALGGVVRLSGARPVGVGS